MNQEYTNMSLEDLVDNVEFINWVRQEANASSWIQWLSTQDKEVQRRFNIGRKMVLSLSDASSSHDMNTQSIDGLWERINATIASKSINEEKANYNQGKIIRLLKPALGIAAAAALLFIFIIQNADSIQTYSTDEASMALTLPSSSVIQLSAESKIYYDEKNWDEIRNVNLQGTAHFDVSKGVPFKVETSLGNVQVLGTSFTVSEKDKTFIVQVSSGRVEVESGSDREILTKGMSYLSNPSTVDISTYKGGDNTILRYTEAPMQDVLIGLSQLYDITFKGKENERGEIVKVIFDSQNLNNALKQAFFAVGWEYEIRGNEVIIS